MTTQKFKFKINAKVRSEIFKMAYKFKQNSIEKYNCPLDDGEWSELLKTAWSIIKNACKDAPRIEGETYIELHNQNKLTQLFSDNSTIIYKKGTKIDEYKTMSDELASRIRTGSKNAARDYEDYLDTDNFTFLSSHNGAIAASVFDTSKNKFDNRNYFSE